MDFTPKFQEVWDFITEAWDSGTPQDELQRMFYAKCCEIGPIERLCNLYRVRDKYGKVVFFHPRPLQLQLLENRTHRDMIVKMRQGGMTTLSCLIALDGCLFNEQHRAAIMAHVKDNVKIYFNITKLAFTQFQKDWGHLYPVTNSKDNVTALGITETGSELYVVTESKGLTLDFLHIAEAAFVSDARISESIESVPAKGWVILETTPDTASGLFYEFWDRFYKGEFSSFKAHFFPWWYVYPEEDAIDLFTPKEPLKLTDEEQQLVNEHGLEDHHIMFRRVKISESGGDKGEFMRKYPEDPRMCFLSGARSIFPASALNSLWKNEKDPNFVGNLVAA